MTKKLRLVLTFFCFFPFIGLNIGTDTQPFALLCAIMLLIGNETFKIYCRNYFYLAVFFLTILSFVSLYFIEPFQIAKRLFSYLSIMLIPIAVYNNFEYNDRHIIEKISKTCIWVWFIVGGVQTFVYSRFMTFLVPLYRTSVTRGVCALASEPSFYGYMCFLFFLLALEFKEKRVLYCSISLVQAVVFAQSSVTLVYFGVYATCMIIGWIISGQIKNYFKIFGIILIACLAVIIILTLFKTSRMGYLLDKMLSNSGNFFETDESVESRWEHIEISFSRYGMPYYLGTIQIMSGFGGAFYEMGVFSLSIFIPIIKAIFQGQNDISGKIGITLSIVVCMLSAINLSSPMFAFYIGLCVINQFKKQSEKSEITAY